MAAKDIRIEQLQWNILAGHGFHSEEEFFGTIGGRGHRQTSKADDGEGTVGAADVGMEGGKVDEDIFFVLGQLLKAKGVFALNDMMVENWIGEQLETEVRIELEECGEDVAMIQIGFEEKEVHFKHIWRKWLVYLKKERMLENVELLMNIGPARDGFFGSVACRSTGTPVAASVDNKSKEREKATSIFSRVASTFRQPLSPIFTENTTTAPSTRPTSATATTRSLRSYLSISSFRTAIPSKARGTVNFFMKKPSPLSTITDNGSGDMIESLLGRSALNRHEAKKLTRPKIVKCNSDRLTLENEIVDSEITWNWVHGRWVGTKKLPLVKTEEEVVTEEEAEMEVLKLYASDTSNRSVRDSDGDTLPSARSA
jgi:hypothetical protein